MGFLLISSSLVLCYLAGADDRVKNHRLAFAKRCSAYHLWPFLGYLRTRGRKRASIPLGNIYVSSFWSLGRSDERRVGKECVRPCRYQWSPYHSNINI